MIDYDLKDVVLTHNGWHVAGCYGVLEFLGVPHAVNCRCSQRSRDCYDQYIDGVTQKEIARRQGVTAPRIYHLVNRVRRCKASAIEHATNAFVGMSERDALYLVSCLNDIATAVDHNINPDA